jgi:hypothetical protein
MMHFGIQKHWKLFKRPSKQKPGLIFKSFKNKKARVKRAFLNTNDYLFITYIVTSKPKRISVAAGVVHMMLVLLFKLIRNYLNVILLGLKK